MELSLKKVPIAEGGAWRLRQGQKALKSEAIAKKYAAELEQAGPAEQGKIRERMAQEHLKREKMISHKPSASSLW